MNSSATQRPGSSESLFSSAYEAVLEQIAAGAALPDVLGQLTRLVETHAPGLLCSILILDADGVHLRHGAAPSLPEAYNHAIDGITIGPSVGSCGTAAYRATPVVVTDIASDPLWIHFKALALAHGLRACWSTPIIAADRQVLGTFAVYYSEPREPDSSHHRMVERATHLAKLALERERAIAVRRQMEEAQVARVEAERVRAYLESLMAQAPAAICVLRGPEHVFELANPRYLQLMPRRQLLGRAIREVFPELEAQGFFALLDRVYTTGEPFVGDGVPVRIDRRGDGTLEERTSNFTYAPLRDASGRIDGVFVLAVDVTEQVAAQRAAEETQRRLEAVVQQMPVAVMVAEAPSGRIVASNRQMEELLGAPAKTLENIEAYAAWKGFHPNGRSVAAHEWPLATAVRGESVTGQELEYVRGDNRHFWLRISAVPVHDELGRVTAAVSIFFDITDLRARMPGGLRPR